MRGAFPCVLKSGARHLDKTGRSISPEARTCEFCGTAGVDRKCAGVKYIDLEDIGECEACEMGKLRRVRRTAVLCKDCGVAKSI